MAFEKWGVKLIPRTALKLNILHSMLFFWWVVALQASHKIRVVMVSAAANETVGSVTHDVDHTIS